MHPFANISADYFLLSNKYTTNKLTSTCIKASNITKFYENRYTSLQEEGESGKKVQEDLKVVVILYI